MSTSVESSDRSAALLEFTPSSRLPVELRTVIWSLATSNESRIVKVFLHAPDNKAWDPRVDGSIETPKNHARHEESRVVGEKFYMLCHEKQQTGEAGLPTKIANEDNGVVLINVAVTLTINTSGNALIINFELDISVCEPKTLIMMLTDCNSGE
ncbi:hypothetical protein WAI453_011677 [Rhynchosporium graminicola]|uniref:2EXR domain-containing protein n=1 Tax=Rhynchosporium graminicola TaxID=2792576 RepID=A0A1E1K0L0_9HELO|nr:uncharacterized protein RCO7_07098 [Rhynchosporium commune]